LVDKLHTYQVRSEKTGSFLSYLLSMPIQCFNSVLLHDSFVGKVGGSGILVIFVIPRDHMLVMLPAKF